MSIRHVDLVRDTSAKLLVSYDIIGNRLVGRELGFMESGKDVNDLIATQKRYLTYVLVVSIFCKS